MKKSRATPPPSQARLRNPEERAGTSNPRDVLFAGAIIAIVALLPYLQTLRHEFIEYDDNQYITQNDVVKQGLTPEGLRWAFTTLAASNWHPVTWISHMVDVQIWGDWAGGHHLTNLILHALNSILVFVALRRMTGSTWRSAVVGAIFAVHPLHVESVAWVAERKDVLSTFFGLFAIMAYVRYVKHPSFGRYALVACGFALSLMSKPMLVTLPLGLLLLDFWPLKRLELTGQSLARAIVEKIPLFAMSIASSIITIIAQKTGGAMHALESLPVLNRMANSIAAYGTYLLQTVWPSNLAVIYPLTTPSAVVVATSLIALVVISGIVIALSRTRPHALVGWLWFLGTLVPVIGLVQVGSQSMADRYMYAPMIGLLIMVAWSVPEPQQVSRSAMQAISALAALITIACVIAAWRQTSHWQDTITLFTRTISVTDRNPFAHNVLGHALRQARRFDESHEQLSIALQLNSNYAPILNNLGLLMTDQGRFAEAQAHYEQSLRLNDHDATVWNNLGNAVLEQGQAAEAEKHYRHALELKPEFPEALVNLGRALAAQGSLDDAISCYGRAIAMRPDFAEAHANLGAALWNQRKADQAISAYQTALKLDPESIDTRVNLGVALASQGQTDQAIAQFEHVLRLDPNRADARQFLDLARRQRDTPAAQP